MYTNYNFPRVYRRGDTLFIKSLTSLQDVSSFLRETRGAFIKAGYDYLKIDLNSVNRVFPNACVPISAIIHHYRQEGYEVLLESIPQRLKNFNFDNPLEPNKTDIFDGLFSKIWKFTTPQQIALLTEAYQNSLAEKVECEKGVVDAFAWCLNEIMDNVLQHSKATVGFIMVQIHPETHKVAVCLSDIGIGIWESLKSSTFNPETSIDAILMAMKEGVTRFC